jgi:hypothetical protein
MISLLPLDLLLLLLLLLHLLCILPFSFPIAYPMFASNSLSLTRYHLFLYLLLPSLLSFLLLPSLLSFLLLLLLTPLPHPPSSSSPPPPPLPLHCPTGCTRDLVTALEISRCARWSSPATGDLVSCCPCCSVTVTSTVSDPCHTWV